jgi:hypothetical protein
MVVLKSVRALGVFAGLFAVLLLRFSSPTVVAQSLAPGGFVEADDSMTTRTALSAAQIASFLPARGAFTFPAPYLTTGIRLTNSTDCASGGDCINPVGYSYWRNINNHVGSNVLYAFVGTNLNKGGVGPILLSYDKLTGATTNLGPLFPASSPYYWSTGEGWYFSATLPTKLYVFNGSTLARYDVVTHALQPIFDAAAQFGPGKVIWQMHSSNDDRVHSFTLRLNSGNYDMLGCGAYDEAAAHYYYFAARGAFDECQIDKSGRYLVIKENVDGLAGEDNVIEDLQTGTETIYYDQQGAGGHSDQGFGYSVAEDNFFSYPGSVRILRFDQPQQDLRNGNGTLVYRGTDWNIGAQHIAHANSVAGTPISQQHACLSSATRLTIPRANEIVCYRLDGSLKALVVAPVMTDLNAAGGGPDDYWKYPKGNLDVTGQYFIWTSNMGTGRMDAFIVRIPTQLIPAGTTAISSAAGGGGAAAAGPLGDFTGDSKPDLLWQHPETGALLLWQMNGSNYVSSTLISPGGTLWQVAGSGDFTGDGKPDIVWQDPSTGAVLLWEMNGATYVSSTMLNAGGTFWRVVAVSDLNGDGKPDLLWQHPTTGAVLLWAMNGTTYEGSTILNAGGTTWRVVAAADFSGDGKPDIVWQDPATGGVLVWTMNGPTYQSGTIVSSGGTMWRVVAVGDYTGDGMNDIVWQDPSSGAVLLWQMNRESFAAGTILSSGGTLWKMKGPR